MEKIDEIGRPFTVEALGVALHRLSWDGQRRTVLFVSPMLVPTAVTVRKAFMFGRDFPFEIAPSVRTADKYGPSAWKVMMVTRRNFWGTAVAFDTYLSLGDGVSRNQKPKISKKCDEGRHADVLVTRG